MLKFKILFILSFVLFSSSLIGQNKLTLRFLSLGGDGFSIMPGCELLYSRNIFNGMDVRLGFTKASKNISLKNDFFTERGKEIITDNLLLESNKSDNPATSFTNYRSYNLGISKDINSSVRSTIGLYIGARYEILDRLFFQSTGDQIEFFSTQSDHEEKLSYEIEVSYNYRISQTVGVNTSFYYSANFLIFAGTLGASVYF